MVEIITALGVGENSVMVEIITALNALTWPGTIAFVALCALLGWIGYWIIMAFMSL